MYMKCTDNRYFVLKLTKKYNEIKSNKNIIKSMI